MATRQPIPGPSFVRLGLCVFLLLCTAPAAYGQATYFVGGPAVSILDYGAFANDVIADTPALIAAMSGGGRTVRVPAGEYRVGKLSIPSNTVLELATGAVLRDTGQLGEFDSLINVVGVSNVRILGGQVTANRAYTTGEFRHGIFVRFAANVEINSVVSSGHGGDGIYLGTGTDRVTIVSTAGTQNRRNGLSIVSGTNVLVHSSVFSSTSGTAPSCGIDAEPNNNGDMVQNITISSVTTFGNAGCGISVFLKAYTPSAPPAIVSIIGHRSFAEPRPYFTVNVRPGIDQVTRR